ncbi:cellulose binding domain-containing protein [Oerskovia sp. M15]
MHRGLSHDVLVVRWLPGRGHHHGGSAAITGWTVRWDLAPATVSQLWGASHTASGTAVTATSLAWNGNLAAGARPPSGSSAAGHRR